VIADAEELTADVAAGIRRRLDEALRVALQSQNLIVGARAASDAFKLDNVGLVLLAADAGESTRTKFATNADRKNIPVCDALTGEELGAVVGGDYVAIMAVAPSRPLAKIRQDLDKLAHMDAL
jgi:ribosomal protein L7Ae-like RNA K-turn-binding protein